MLPEKNKQRYLYQKNIDGASALKLAQTESTRLQDILAIVAQYRLSQGEEELIENDEQALYETIQGWLLFCPVTLLALITVT